MKTDHETTGLIKELLPRHVAIIMDGNGRWAKERGKPRVWGHKNGVDSVRDVVKTAGELGITALTLYAFSEENWGRPKDEVSALMSLLNTYVVKERKELDRQNVRFRTIGDLSKLPEKTKALVLETEELLATNSGLILTIALSYGGRGEIVEAAKTIAASVAKGEIDANDIDAELFQSCLMTNDLPDPDFLIRTSGEQRLSNFLLWQSAYTEFHFTPEYWPDFRKESFIKALTEYQTRNRRFGKVPGTTANKTTGHEVQANS